MSLDRRLHEESDGFEAAALFMAGEPGCAERTLAAHRREENGSTCAGCRRSPEHPCFLAKVALRALELLAAESTTRGARL
ncbi:hypothetical protein [Pseudonocardia spinosispora]|uniref:hypothetical protein n=1 Tax=Pseudonocardia spinosispora TaxID=103441 RepID=UPI000420C19B|nr:hypothetical protein [Pseudonocardia spinosispora]